MVHDFITTAEHVIFPIFPLSGLERTMRGEPPFACEPELGARIGVMPRDASVADLRWFEMEPCYVFHPVNAYTDGTRVVAHVMQYEEALFPRADSRPTNRAKARARLAEWAIDDTYRLPDGDVAGEPLFVPRDATAQEGDGSLLTVIYRARDDRSDFAPLDASDLGAGPVALGRLPHRVPFGFHGNWRPAA